MGMVRASSADLRRPGRSPHVRGDGPYAGDAAPDAVTFSPRAWGWSARQLQPIGRRAFSPRAWGWSGLPTRAATSWRVLPTCVGMVRDCREPVVATRRSPHVRGDGPAIRRRRLDDAVLPTCVGMVRSRRTAPGDASRSPHVRGDGPSHVLAIARRATFSPRAWGWSVTSCARVAGSRVLPTCVGMVRRLELLGCDVAQFSPRAWGWSGTRDHAMQHRHVLPTCVGMVRRSGSCATRSARSPHVRGDGPLSPAIIGAVVHRSPHVRGDGPDRPWHDRADRSVLPTCVGMVRTRSSIGSCVESVLPTCVGMVRRWHARRSPVVVLPTCVGMVRRHAIVRGPATVLPTCVGMVRSATVRSCTACAFSPRAWGWSANRASAHSSACSSPHVRGDGPRYRRQRLDAQRVLPTCVGMVRTVAIDRPDRTRSPHVRGDGPSARLRSSRRADVLPTCVGMVRRDAADGAVDRAFSPRAWGWSGLGQRACRRVPRSPHVRGDGPAA